MSSLIFACQSLLQCSNRDVLGGWCDSGNIFVADVGAQQSEINILEDLINEYP